MDKNGEQVGRGEGYQVTEEWSGFSTRRLHWIVLFDGQINWDLIIELVNFSRLVCGVLIN